MSEKPLSFEKKEITEQELIGVLQSGEIGDPATREAVARWTKQEEKKVGNDPEASIRFNIKRGNVYFLGGYPQEALEVLEDARMQAHQEQRTELYNEIMDMMDSIEANTT